MKIIVCLLIFLGLLYNYYLIKRISNKEKWISKVFFFNDFTDVWGCTNKGAMRVPYRERINDILESAANHKKYLFDEPGERALYIEYKSNKVVFRRFIFTSVTISNSEFIDLLNKYTEMYMEKFSCLKSEREKYLDFLSKAKENFRY